MDEIKNLRNKFINKNSIFLTIIIVVLANIHYLILYQKINTKKLPIQYIDYWLLFLVIFVVVLVPYFGPIDEKNPSEIATSEGGGIESISTGGACKGGGQPDIWGLTQRDIFQRLGDEGPFIHREDLPHVSRFVALNDLGDYNLRGQHVTFLDLIGRLYSHDRETLDRANQSWLQGLYERTQDIVQAFPPYEFVRRHLQRLRDTSRVSPVIEVPVLEVSGVDDNAGRVPENEEVEFDVFKNTPFSNILNSYVKKLFNSKTKEYLKKKGVNPNQPTVGGAEVALGDIDPPEFKNIKNNIYLIIGLAIITVISYLFWSLGYKSRIKVYNVKVTNVNIIVNILTILIVFYLLIKVLFKFVIGYKMFGKTDNIEIEEEIYYENINNIFTHCKIIFAILFIYYIINSFIIQTNIKNKKKKEKDNIL